jgi:hypothetical protein
MGVNAQGDIGKALDAHLLAMAGAWPISFEGLDFVPPADGKYLRASFQPNETETRNLDAGGYYYKGLYAVMAVTKLGIGKYPALGHAALVAQRFSYLTELVTPSGTLRIYQEPSVRGGVKSGANYEVPIIVRYHLTTN